MPYSFCDNRVGNMSQNMKSTDNHDGDMGTCLFDLHARDGDGDGVEGSTST